MTTRSAEQLAQAFEAGDIRPGGFNHAAHVIVAYQLLTRYEFLEAVSRYTRGIRELASRAGAPEKFNITITLAFLSLIAERMADAPSSDAEAFVRDNSDLMTIDVLRGRYSNTRLNKSLARSVFLMPDVTASSHANDYATGGIG